MKHRKKCGSCAARAWRATDPVRSAFNNLKSHAKQRGKPFTITLDYFRAFCIKTKYLAGRGRSADSYHVDRIDERLGYVPGNLQVLTNSENVKKYLSYDWQSRYATVYTSRPTAGTNLPF